MKKEELALINQKYKKKLKNLNIYHKPIIICFSGVPGSGKTYISKILEKRYRAVRINNDDIRKVIDKVEKKNKQKLLQEYLSFFLKTYAYKNGFIILDSSIDRKYKSVFDLAKKQRFKVLVIALDVSKEEIFRRITKRNKNTKEDFIKNFDRWNKDYQQFNKIHKRKFTLRNNQNSDLKSLFKLIDKLNLKQ